MRSSYVIAAGLAIGVSAWIASGNIGGAHSEPEAKPEPAVAQPLPEIPVRVRTFQAERVDKKLTLLGRTEASRFVDVRAETAGQVLEVPVEKGRKVHTGETLVQISPDDRPARLDEAHALVRQRELEYEAAKKLSEKNFRSKTALAAAEASLVSARANLAAIDVDIRHTTITAPFDGVLESRSVEVGDFVDKGEAVASVIDLDPLTVSIEVPEQVIVNVTQGTKAEVLLVDGEAIVGEVTYISSRASESTRTFRVEVELANPEGRLREGTTASVTLPLGATMAHRLSPAVLTLSDAGEVGVRTVDDNGVVQFHPITMVADTENGMWLGGLPETARVIVVGQEYVRAGQKVKAVPVGLAEQN
ncbi:MAG: efflux RND transporter periplasmic adaptor subunit [Magnetospiraceae bacterium]